MPDNLYQISVAVDNDKQPTSKPAKKQWLKNMHHEKKCAILKDQPPKTQQRSSSLISIFELRRYGLRGITIDVVSK